VGGRRVDLKSPCPCSISTAGSTIQSLEACELLTQTVGVRWKTCASIPGISAFTWFKSQKELV
jgi:hypothetical protein